MTSSKDYYRSIGFSITFGSVLGILPFRWNREKLRVENLEEIKTSWGWMRPWFLRLWWYFNVTIVVIITTLAVIVRKKTGKPMDHVDRCILNALGLFFLSFAGMAVHRKTIAHEKEPKSV